MKSSSSRSRPSPPARRETRGGGQATCTFYLFRRMSRRPPRAERMRHDACYRPAKGRTRMNLLVHSPVDPDPRRAADLAVQFWLGLLSERGARSHPADPRRAGADTDRAIAPKHRAARDEAGSSGAARPFYKLDPLPGRVCACFHAARPGLPASHAAADSSTRRTARALAASHARLRFTARSAH